MVDLCNLDGVITPLEQARIPVLDRGFLFGDSVYEVLRTWRGVPLAWPEHLERLRASAAGIALELDLDDRDVMRRVKATVAAAEPATGEAYIRIIVTRGRASAPNIDLAYAPGPPRFLILVRDLPPPAAGEAGRIAIIDRLRNDRRALDPAYKTGNYLNNVLGLAEAKRRGATDAVFLNASGHVTEASTSNVFAVRAGRVLTPPLGAGILAGVTRSLILQVCAAAGITAVEADLTRAELLEADELFLTSTLRAVLPIAAVDGEPHGGATAEGSMTRRLAALLARECDERTHARYGPAYAAL
jgi:branched-chain amino acid aminotransferase